jgi:hypothetical protein
MLELYIFSNLDGLKNPSSVCVLYEEYCKVMEKNLIDVLLVDMKVCFFKTFP